MFLQDNDDAPFRWLIADALRSNLAHDRQCEGHRGHYLYDLIRASHAPDFYREVVFNALVHPREEDYTEQLLQVAAIFARDGDQELRSAFYNAFARELIERHRLDGEDALLKMDGLDGYRRAVRLLMMYPLAEEWRWQEGSLWRDACQQFGEEAVMRLGDYAPELAVYIDERRHQAREKKRKEPSAVPPLPSYEELKRLIEVPQSQGIIHARDWAEEMSASQVAQLIQDMTRETDPVRLRRYLRLLRFTPDIPDPAPIIALTRDDSNPRLVRDAIYALKELTHSEVRARGEELMADLNNTRHVANGLDLLVANPQDGDYAKITVALHRVAEQGQDALHDVNFGARDYFEVNPGPEAVALLLFLYEKLACTLCRASCVRRLRDADALPDWLRSEGRFDASTDIREMVVV